MPNHAHNRLEISCYNAEHVVNSIVNGSGEVDFKLLIPMPADLNVPSRSDAGILWDAMYGDWKSIAKYPWVRKSIHPEQRLDLIAFLVSRANNPEAVRLAKRYEKNRKRYGFKDWFDWAIANWGTKWNAYDDIYEVLDYNAAVVLFSSAWTPPIPVIEELARKHPEAEIVHYFASEFLDFYGYCRYKGGKRVEEEYVENVDHQSVPEWASDMGNPGT